MTNPTHPKGKRNSSPKPITARGEKDDNHPNSKSPNRQRQQSKEQQQPQPDQGKKGADYINKNKSPTRGRKRSPKRNSREGAAGRNDNKSPKRTGGEKSKEEVAADKGKPCDKKLPTRNSDAKASDYSPTIGRKGKYPQRRESSPKPQEKKEIAEADSNGCNDRSPTRQQRKGRRSPQRQGSTDSTDKSPIRQRQTGRSPPPRRESSPTRTGEGGNEVVDADPDQHTPLINKKKNRNRATGRAARQQRERQNRPDAVIFPPNPNETGMEVIERIFESFGLTDTFPKDCEKQMNDILKKHQASLTDEEDLTDDTNIPYITIDNDNSMDLDQAMYITKKNLPGLSSQVAEEVVQSTTGYLVSYALADGAYYVPASSPLFRYSLKRGGSSFYLPGKSIPMLPRELSEDVMSLNPNVARRALVFDMYLDSQGNPLKTFYKWSKIKSRWKGSYREVSQYYDCIDNGDKVHWILNEDYQETIDLLREVGTLRRQLASDRHVVDYNNVISNANDEKTQHQGASVGIALDDETGELVFQTREHYVAELYNEQISLLCNSEGARVLHFMDSLETKIGQHDVVQPIYRTQDKPRTEQFNILEAVITNTLHAHQIDPKKWGWSYEDGEGESIAKYLQRIRSRRDAYKLHSAEYKTWSAIIKVAERQSMITNVRASFTKHSGRDGHFGLKVDYYARFSSPMRELIGCYTHKELKEGHYGQSEFTPQQDVVLRDKLIAAALKGKQIQKKLNGALFLHMMNTLFYKDLMERRLHLRPIRKGILMGMDFSEQRNKSRRCYVKLDHNDHDNDNPLAGGGIEVKVFAQDLEYFYNCRYVATGDKFGKHGSTIEIGPLSGSYNAHSIDDVADHHDDLIPPTFKAGQRVTIRVADYAQFYGQPSRSRWCFIMDVDSTESKPSVRQLNQSTLRGSILHNSNLFDLLGGDFHDDDDSDFFSAVSSQGEGGDSESWSRTSAESSRGGREGGDQVLPTWPFQSVLMRKKQDTTQDD